MIVYLMYVMKVMLNHQAVQNDQENRDRYFLLFSIDDVRDV